MMIDSTLIAAASKSPPAIAGALLAIAAAGRVALPIIERLIPLFRRGSGQQCPLHEAHAELVTRVDERLNGIGDGQNEIKEKLDRWETEIFGRLNADEKDIAVLKTKVGV
jgi:hypothetical protein